LEHYYPEVYHLGRQKSVDFLRVLHHHRNNGRLARCLVKLVVMDLGIQFHVSEGSRQNQKMDDHGTGDFRLRNELVAEVAF